MNQPSDAVKPAVLPPVALVVCAGLAYAADRLVAIPFLPASASRHLLGGALAGLGVAFALWAVTTLFAAGTTPDLHKPTTTIVEAGPYRFSRNPIYAGMALILLGLAFLLNSLWQFAALAIFLAVIRRAVVAREESYLAAKFGADYRAYAARVRRWI